MASIEPCTSPLMTSGNSFSAGGLQRHHHLFERTALAGLAGSGLVAGETLTILGDFAGTAFVFDDGELVARLRRAGKTEDLDRHRRRRFLDVFALVVDECAHAAPLVAGNDDLARAQRALLNEDGGNGAAAAIELGFDDGAFRRAVRIGLEIEDFGLQQDGFEQLVEVGAVLRRDFDVEHFTAHGFDEHFMLQQLGCGPSADRLRACRSC